jgi:hypothetical protein
MAHDVKFWNGPLLGHREMPDGNHQAIYDFLYYNVTGISTEAELRLGRMMDRKTEQRWAPACVKTLTPVFKHGAKFVPGVSAEAFTALTAALRMQAAQRRCLMADMPAVTDRYYADGVRATYVRGTSLQTCVTKQRIEDLDFVNPSMKYDFRVSASCEFDADEPAATETIIKTRVKKRTRFLFGAWAVDLTHVTTGSEVTYEVELQISARQKFLSARETATARDQSQFLECVHSALQYILSLADTAGRGELIAEKAAAADAVIQQAVAESKPARPAGAAAAAAAGAGQSPKSLKHPLKK